MANANVLSVEELAPVAGVGELFDGRLTTVPVSVLFQGFPMTAFITSEIVGNPEDDTGFVLSELNVRHYDGAGWSDTVFPDTLDWIGRADGDDPPSLGTGGLAASGDACGPVSGLVDMCTDGETVWLAVAATERLEYTSYLGTQQIGYKCVPPSLIFPAKGPNTVPIYDTDLDQSHNTGLQFWTVCSVRVFAYTGGSWNLVYYRPSATLNNLGATEGGTGDILLRIASHPGAGYCWLVTDENGFRGKTAQYPYTNALMITTKLDAGGQLEEHYRNEGTPSWWADDPGGVTACDDHKASWKSLPRYYEGGYYGPDAFYGGIMLSSTLPRLNNVITDAGAAPVVVGLIYDVTDPGRVVAPPPPPVITLGPNVIDNGAFNNSDPYADWSIDPSYYWIYDDLGRHPFAKSASAVHVDVGASPLGVGNGMRIYAGKQTIWGPVGTLQYLWGLFYTGINWKPESGTTWQIKYWTRRVRDVDPVTGQVYCNTTSPGDVNPDPPSTLGIYTDRRRAYIGPYGAFHPHIEAAGLGFVGATIGDWVQVTRVIYMEPTYASFWAGSFTYGVTPFGISFMGGDQFYDAKPLDPDGVDVTPYDQYGMAFEVANVEVRQLFFDGSPTQPDPPTPPPPAVFTPPIFQAVDGTSFLLLQYLDPPWTGADNGQGYGATPVLDGQAYIAMTNVEQIVADYYPEEVTAGPDYGRQIVDTIPIDGSDIFTPISDALAEDVSLAKNPLLSDGPINYSGRATILFAVTNSPSRTVWFLDKTADFRGENLQIFALQAGCPLPDGQHGRYAWQPFTPVARPIGGSFPWPADEVPVGFDAVYDPDGKIVYAVAWSTDAAGQPYLACWAFQLCLGCVSCVGYHTWTEV